MFINPATQQFFMKFDRGVGAPGSPKVGQDNFVDRVELKRWIGSGNSEEKAMAKNLLANDGKVFERYAGEDGKLSLEEANKYIADYKKATIQSGGGI